VGDLTRSPKPETQHETRNPKPEPETRNPKPETRNPKPDAQDPKTEIRNPKIETQEPKSESRKQELKQWVTAEPEVKRRTLEEGDEFLVLATDGLWDVLSNDDAARIVSHEKTVQVFFTIQFTTHFTTQIGPFM